MHTLGSNIITVSYSKLFVYIYLIYLLQVPSYILMGIAREPSASLLPKSLPPLAEACSRLDLTAIHEILEKVGYKDDEGIANEVETKNTSFKFFCWRTISLRLIHWIN